MCGNRVLTIDGNTRTDPAMHALVLHSVRGGPAGERRLGHLPSVSRASAAGPAEAVGPWGSRVGEVLRYRAVAQ